MQGRLLSQILTWLAEVSKRDLSWILNQNPSSPLPYPKRFLGIRQEHGFVQFLRVNLFSRWYAILAPFHRSYVSRWSRAGEKEQTCRMRSRFCALPAIGEDTVSPFGVPHSVWYSSKQRALFS